MTRLVGLLGWCGLTLACAAQPLYECTFEKAELGKVPEDFLVLDGLFAVREEAGNKFLELPGAPLETYGLLFGPTEGAGIAVTARIHSASKGRRYPVFGVGLNGVGGYKLQITPAKNALELHKGDQGMTSAEFKWKSGQWTTLRLQVRKAESDWTIEGKAWQGDQEPNGWMIRFRESSEPSAGRPAIWGSPFSGQPIRYDDLVVDRAK